MNSLNTDLNSSLHPKQLEEREIVVAEKMRRATNLFNTAAEVTTPDIPSKVFASEKRVALERCEAEWREFLMNQLKKKESLEAITNDIVHAKPLDDSILNNDQKNFFDSSINCDKWLQESTAFRQKLLEHIKHKANFAGQQEFVNELVHSELHRSTLSLYPRFSFRSLKPNAHIVCLESDDTIYQ